MLLLSTTASVFFFCRDPCDVRPHVVLFHSHVRPNEKFVYLTDWQCTPPVIDDQDLYSCGEWHLHRTTKCMPYDILHRYIRITVMFRQLCCSYMVVWPSTIVEDEIHIANRYARMDLRYDTRSHTAPFFPTFKISYFAEMSKYRIFTYAKSKHLYLCTLRLVGLHPPAVSFKGHSGLNFVNQPSTVLPLIDPLPNIQWTVSAAVIPN